MSLGPDARALLNAAADGDEPSDADLARVQRKLAARLALGAAAGATAMTATKTAAATVPMTSLLGVKLGVAALLLAAAGATAAVVTRQDARVATAPVVTATHVNPAPASAAASPAGREIAASAEPALVSSAHVGGPAAPDGVILEGPVRTPVSTARTATAPGSGSPHDTTGTSLARGAGGGSATTGTGAGRAAAGVDSGRAAAGLGSGAILAGTLTVADEPRVPAAPPRDTVAEEASLLRAANGALARNDGKTALARVDEHAARFPNGALTEEREATRVFALCALGRVADSRTAAAAFVTMRPRSPLAAQVRRTCTIAP